MSDLFEVSDGATPLADGDRKGLLRTDIATRGELNTAEAQNIADATAWAFSLPRTSSWLLTRQRLKDVHRRMLVHVWAWAGEFRRHDLAGVGVDWTQIPTQLEDLLRDVQAQIGDGQSLSWPADEIAVRFHHRLLFIHPFPNGNGRHGRLAADLLVSALGLQRFAWGGTATHLLTRSPALTEARDTYLAALRIADTTGDYQPLLDFARDGAS